MILLPRIHDLLGPLSPGVVLAEEHAQQENADRWLFQGPFVVVRRAAPVAVGSLSAYAACIGRSATLPGLRKRT